MRLRAGAATDIGCVRDLNEDAYALRADEGLFVICDGMGGAPAGEVASQIAVDTILAQLNGYPRIAAAPPPPVDEGYLPQTVRLADALRRSNQFIYDEAHRDPNKADMGTTVVAALMQHHVTSVAHVGDSRAYLWHGDRLEPVTRDHSLVEAQIRAGVIDREDSLRSDQQNVLVRVLGREPDVEVDVTEVPVQPGDYLLLCSDGLTRMVPERTVADAIGRLRDSQRICDYLVDAANRNGGADNITVIVVEVEENWWRRVSNRWSRYVRGAYDAKAYPAV
jgi:protein phosphatase